MSFPTAFASAASPLFDPPRVAGVLPPGVLEQVSGLAASAVNPGVLWAHNDAGGSNTLFALSPLGELLANFTLTGASNQDWEDLAVGPGPVVGESYAYLADTGAATSTGTIYRFREPVLGSDSTVIASTGIEAFSVAFGVAGSALRAEALMVDPLGGELVLITKEAAASRVVSAALADLSTADVLSLSSRGNLDQPAAGRFIRDVTAADVASDGQSILVRNNGNAWLWHRDPGVSLSTALLSADPITVPLAAEPKGEAIAFAHDLSGYFTVSERPRFGPSEQPLSFHAVVPEPGTLLASACLAPIVLRRRRRRD